MPRVKIKRLYACAVKAIAAITRIICTNVSSIFSHSNKLRLHDKGSLCTPIDIYDLWKRNGINKSSIFWQY